ncbi:MAG: thrombospondin type 3 repeat-containing protein [Planctomycetota bacterium]|nr:thrombospondin type 3 repeat-containing protein [Planctomycetota bacterium]
MLASKACVSKDRDGSVGPAVNDLGDIGTLNLGKVEPAEQAWKSVLAGAGALPHDATSARMVRETRTGTGQQGYQADINADRAALKAVAVAQDSDGDGLPDSWELKSGLDPKKPDSTEVSASGYTFLELYCHDRAAKLIDAAGP